MTREQFKAMRLKHQMTQHQFATEVGVGVNSVRRYESGESEIPKVVKRSLMLLDLIPPVKPKK